MIGFRYESGKRYARVSESATVHPTASIGDPPEHRQWWSEQLDSQYVGTGEAFPTLIRDGARVGPFCTVDAGFKGSTMVGAGSWLMASVHVGHDSVIGENCEISCFTGIGGHVRIGDRVRIGQNVCIKPFVEIGDGARIGQGSVVTRNVPAGEVWAGNPAEPLDRLVARRRLQDQVLDDPYDFRPASQSEVRGKDWIT